MFKSISLLNATLDRSNYYQNNKCISAVLLFFVFEICLILKILPFSWEMRSAWKFEVMRLKSEKKAVPTQWKRNKVNFHEKWQTQRKRQIRWFFPVSHQQVEGATYMWSSDVKKHQSTKETGVQKTRRTRCFGDF